MKIIAVDNFARETVADRLVAENVSDTEGQIMVRALRATCHGTSSTWYELKDDDFVLSRGMADLI